MHDRDPLAELLSHWQPTPAEAPDFAAEVHRRLRRAQPRAGAIPTGGRFARLVAFPIALPLAAGIAIVLGVTTALTLNHAQLQDRMANAYARSIDPLQMTAMTRPPR